MLWATDNGIGVDGARMLAEAITVNTALQHIDLDGMAPVSLPILSHAHPFKKKVRYFLWQVAQNDSKMTNRGIYMHKRLPSLIDFLGRPKNTELGTITGDLRCNSFPP